jgi:GR25 family glycosyltransferase involved in LPS biosynthesis
MINQKVYYINLDNRTDRNLFIQNQLTKIFSNVVRISAEDGKKITNNYNISSMVGCVLSHIKTLKLALENTEDNVFVFEDDFEIEGDIEENKKRILNLLNLDFNIILLSYHIPMVKINNIRNGIADVSNGQTTSGYLIKKSFIPVLIDNLENSLKNLILTGDLSSFSLDQYWKLLQNQDNKFYCSIPRIGKQRDDFSDISKMNVSYGGFCFMGILSCEKNRHKRLEQNLDKCIFNYKYFLGNPNLNSAEIDGDIVYLPCGDHYENLTEKTKLMMEWILENYPSVDYIFKTDDDIVFDFEVLMSQYSQLTLNNYKYCGNFVSLKRHQSDYHYNKCHDKSLENPILLDDLNYCSGGGYFLSSESAKIVIRDIDNHSNIFEDYSVAKTLNNSGIYPTEINIYNTSCFW